MDTIDLIFKSYEVFLIVFIRTSGIFVFSPLFNSENIPNVFKVGLSLALSGLITLTLPSSIDLSNQILLILIFKELMVGIIIGFIAYIFFTAFYVMGQIIDMKIGFSMVSVVDPQSKIQVPLTGNLFYMLAFLLLLGINGHHVIIHSLIDSFTLIPIGTFVYSEEVFQIILKAFISSFEIGFKLSTPIIAVIFLTDIVLGVLARTIPQMNVFVVGMPLKILIGVFILMIALPIFFSGVGSIFDMIITYLDMFLKIG